MIYSGALLSNNKSEGKAVIDTWCGFVEKMGANGLSYPLRMGGGPFIVVIMMLISPS